VGVVEYTSTTSSHGVVGACRPVHVEARNCGRSEKSYTVRCVMISSVVSDRTDVTLYAMMFGSG
jgi:hypothetical protein